MLRGNYREIKIDFLSNILQKEIDCGASSRFKIQISLLLLQFSMVFYTVEHYFHYLVVIGSTLRYY